MTLDQRINRFLTSDARTKQRIAGEINEETGRQLSLLDIPERPVVDQSPRAELERVSSRIALKVLDFCKQRATSEPEFHMQELTEYVARFETVAPDSAGRILRDLKAKGVVKYELVSRRQSLYRVEAA